MCIDDLKWNDGLKFVVLITDAPAHGKAYHNLGDDDDDYINEDMTEELK